jgi:hypothetical protein
MCRRVSGALLGIFLILVVSAAFADPAWVVVSTEVDENFDPAGFQDRQGLRLDYPGYAWPGSIFFDPGPGVLGIETGLDAFHYSDNKNGDTTSAPGGLYFFSTEVDVSTAEYTFEDEDLLAYDPTTGLVTEVFDVKNLLGPTGAPLGLDYGLDAITRFEEVRWETVSASSTEVDLLPFGWAFSTEVDVLPLGVTAGDVIFTDGAIVLGTWNVQQVFDHEVGLDALHILTREDGPDRVKYEFIISTEVDGSVFDPHSQQWVPFKNEDIVMLMFDPANNLLEANVPWRGTDSYPAQGFDHDVGLDALYLGPMVPEPATMLLAGVGLLALVLRLRRKS